MQLKIFNIFPQQKYIEGHWQLHLSRQTKRMSFAHLNVNDNGHHLGRMDSVHASSSFRRH